MGLIKILFASLFLTIKLTVPFVEHTYEDTLLVAKVAYLENGSTGKNEDENTQCLIATMAVFVNRMKGEGWGGPTAKGVLNMKGQYAVETKNRIEKCDPPQYVIDLAEEVLTYGTNVPEYVVYQSMQKNLGTCWKVIAGEYFATNGGHKDEGKDLVIVTKKKEYQQAVIRDLVKQWNKSLKKIKRDLKRIFGS